MVYEIVGATLYVSPLSAVAPSLHANLETRLDHVRSVNNPPFSVGVNERNLPRCQFEASLTVNKYKERESERESFGEKYLISPHQGRHKLVNLHSRNMLAQAYMGPGAEMEQGSIHPARALLIRKPTLWAVGVAVFPERFPITLHDPGVTSHKGAAGDEMPADGGSGRWHDAFGHHAESGVHAECFLDASVEIGQFTGFGKGGLEVWRAGG